VYRYIANDFHSKMLLKEWCSFLIKKKMGGVSGARDMSRPYPIFPRTGNGLTDKLLTAGPVTLLPDYRVNMGSGK
jgi:hypothetical protein